MNEIEEFEGSAIATSWFGYWWTRSRNRIRHSRIFKTNQSSSGDVPMHKRMVFLQGARLAPRLNARRDAWAYMRRAELAYQSRPPRKILLRDAEGICKSLVKFFICQLQGGSTKGAKRKGRRGEVILTMSLADDMVRNSPLTLQHAQHRQNSQSDK